MTINDPRSSLLMIPQVEYPLVVHGHWLWLCPIVSIPECRLMEKLLSGALPVLWQRVRKTWQTRLESDTCPLTQNPLAEAH